MAEIIQDTPSEELDHETLYRALRDNPSPGLVHSEVMGMISSARRTRESIERRATGLLVLGFLSLLGIAFDAAWSGMYENQMTPGVRLAWSGLAFLALFTTLFSLLALKSAPGFESVCEGTVFNSKLGADWHRGMAYQKRLVFQGMQRHNAEKDEKLGLAICCFGCLVLAAFLLAITQMGPMG